MKKQNAQIFVNHVNNLREITGINNYHDALTLYKRLHRLEARIHRENEDDCSGTSGLTGEQAEERDKRRFKSYQSLLPNVRGLFINGDPRGYALKMHVKERQEWDAKGVNLYSDWGGGIWHFSTRFLIIAGGQSVKL